MNQAALDRIALLRQEARRLYAAMGIENPGRDLEEVLETEVLEVFKLYLRQETGKALKVYVPLETELEEEEEEDELEEP